MFEPLHELVKAAEKRKAAPQAGNNKPPKSHPWRAWCPGALSSPKVPTGTRPLRDITLTNRAV